MFFKQTYSARRTHVRNDGDLPTTILLSDNSKITLWMRQSRDNDKLHRHLCIDHIIDIQPPQRVVSTLHSLLHKILLVDTPPQDGLPYEINGETIVDIDGNILGKYPVPFELLPKGSKPWLSSIKSKSSDIIRSYFKTLRWRQAASGAHQPLSYVNFQWSDDGESWTNVPMNLHFTVHSPSAFDTRHSALETAAKLMENETEPFAHELIREATELSNTAPRSALLIGFSALETGTKSYISWLLPGSDALIEKLPSPPLLSLLRDVIPSINSSRRINSAHFPLPKAVLENIQKWTTQRNQIAHGAKKTVDYEDLRSFLDLVTELLYALDAERGHEWAIEHFRSGYIAPIDHAGSS